MGKIVGLGTLSFTQNDRLMNDRGIDVESGLYLWNVTLTLEKPIEITDQTLKNMGLDMDGLINELNVHINGREVSEDGPFSNGRFYNLLPHDLIKAFLFQGSYNALIEPAPREEDESGNIITEIKIMLLLNFVVRNQTNFLRSFTRKLRKWIIGAKAKAEAEAGAEKN